MCKASMRDVRRRQLNLLSCQNEVTFNVPTIFKSVCDHYNSNNARLVLNNWIGLSQCTNEAFSMVLDLFNVITEKGSVSDIHNATTVICNNIIPNIKNAYSAYDNIRSNMSKVKNETAVGSYSKMAYAADIYRQCDRVLENYNKLSKRFIIDDTIKDLIINTSVYETVIELCKLIDTYSAPDAIKYNVALENIMYGFDKNGVIYDQKDILEAATDYFMLTRTNIENDDIEALKKIITENKFYDDSNIKSIVTLFDDRLGILTENTTDEVTAFLRENVNVTKDAINSFKIQDNKTVDTLKAMVNSIYCPKNSDIVTDIIDILNVIRVFYVSNKDHDIDKILDTVSSITKYCLNMNLCNTDIDKVIIYYETEINKITNKLKIITNDDIIQRMNSYKQKLTQDLSELQMYKDTIFNSTKDDTDEIEEMANILGLANITESICDWDKNTIMTNLYKNAKIYDIDFLESVANFAMLVPSLLDPKELINVYEQAIDDKDYYRRDSIKLIQHKLIQYRLNNYIESDTISPNVDPVKEYSELVSINECMNIIKDVMSLYSNAIYEMDITNTLKLAMIKLKKAIVKLSDKEKAISRQIDASMATLEKSVKRAISNDNREAIIKGSIIPSASKIIKTAIVTGVAAFFNPAMAAIGLLGSLAVSKQMQHKERQLILDDIEIELKMVDKYIRIAEEKNDMKATRQLLITQRSLERQRQRIKYKMNVVGSRPIPNVPSYNSDSD